MPQAVVFSSVLGGGHLTGVQWLRYLLELLAVLLRHKGVTAYGPLELGWVIPSVPGTKAFIPLITKLISYYLN